MSVYKEDILSTSDNSPHEYKNGIKNKTNFKKENKIEQDSKLISVFSKIILELIEENKKQIKKEKILIPVNHIFYMKTLPNIQLEEYLSRINKYIKPEISTLIICLIYIDKICSCKKNRILLIENNIFKLFLSSIIIAVKYNEDFYDDNNYFAKVGGISLSEINSLEKEFLNLINFGLYVSSDIFEKYHKYLKKY